MNKYETLKKYYGYDSFRPGQEVLIDAVLNKRDVLGISTGTKISSKGNEYEVLKYSEMAQREIVNELRRK